MAPGLPLLQRPIIEPEKQVLPARHNVVDHVAPGEAHDEDRGLRVLGLDVLALDESDTPALIILLFRLALTRHLWDGLGGGCDVPFVQRNDGGPGRIQTCDDAVMSGGF